MHVAKTTKSLDVAALARRVAALEKAVAGQRRRPKLETPLPWRKEWMPRFLGVLRRTGNVSAAIRSRGVPARATVYEHFRRCERFRAAWSAALVQSGRGAS